ncbi:MAG: ABC transporter permease subunit [Oscillospiraceae bacterium]|nr:ABC transporter permease subunit [Oscillospiraceae bacterium]
MARRHKHILITLAAILFWLLVWEAVFRLVGREILVVSPIRAVSRLFELGQTAPFWNAVFSTCRRVLEGFGLSVFVGSALAILTSRSQFFRYLFAPILKVLRATPVASVILLFLVWMATARVPVFVVFLMVTPIVWTNLFAGLEVMDAQLLEMGQVFRFGTWKKIRYIYLPALMPYIVAALTTGLGAAWKTAIGAEVIARPAGGMGRAVYDTRIHLLTADLFAWTIAVIALSVLLEKVMVLLLAFLNRKLAGTKRRVKYAD